MLRFIALAALLMAAACGDKATETPTSPTPPAGPVSLAGTYAGTVSDASGPGRLTWQLTQSNAAVSGTFTAVDDVSGVTANGSVSGTVSGATLTFRMAAAPGSLPSPFAACSLELDGTAQVATTSIEGSYSGRNSCTGPFANGRLSLTKQ